MYIRQITEDGIDKVSPENCEGFIREMNSEFVALSLKNEEHNTLYEVVMTVHEFRMLAKEFKTFKGL